MLFKLENVTKKFNKIILDNVSWQFNPGTKASLVGRNGAGKTTLFEIILGREQIDNGRVECLKGTSFSYFSQKFDLNEELTVIEHSRQASDCLNKLSFSLRELEEKMEGIRDEKSIEKLASKYSVLQEEFMREGGYEFPSRCEEVLQGLGFGKREMDLKISQLSGGQKSRIALALVILNDANTLLLDEPTNHLDFMAIDWLENYLVSTDKAFILVSHDRYFLDKVSKVTIELENGKLTEFKGNYSTYKIQKKQRVEMQEKQFVEQQEFIKKTEDFVQRNMAGQKTKQAQSRRKMLEKLEVIERPVYDESCFAFRFEEGERGGNIVVRIENLAVGYGELCLVKNINLIMQRQERIALVGPNGCGKTTLLKTVAGLLTALNGDISFGANIRPGYFDQELKILDEKKNVMDQIWDDNPTEKAEEIRKYLGSFGFCGEDVFRPVTSLSGGESGRLSLAKVIAGGYNLLLLDEPTNHLDIENRKSLIDSLSHYGGSLIFVTHDRYFLESVATKLLVLSDGKLDDCYRSFSEYCEKYLAKKSEKELKVREEKIQKRKVAKASKPTRKVDKKRELKAIEERISNLEKKIEEIDRILNSPFEQLDSDNIHYQKRLRSNLEEEIDILYEEWDELSD